MGWKKQAFSRKNAREMVKYGDGFGGILDVGEETPPCGNPFRARHLGAFRFAGSARLSAVVPCEVLCGMSAPPVQRLCTPRATAMQGRCSGHAPVRRQRGGRAVGPTSHTAFGHRSRRKLNSTLLINNFAVRPNNANFAHILYKID